jgi:uncharacterized protein YbbC (DUF1343 family)
LAGKPCGGVQIHVLDRDKFDPVEAGIAVVKIARDMYPEQFKWKEPPYEYVYDKNPFDVISGTDSLRVAIEGGVPLQDIASTWKDGLDGFRTTRKPYLLY